MILEVCCGNIESVKGAIEGGADRIELCRDLELDGLTPHREMIREAVRLCRPAGVVVHVLIRSREGHFVYTDAEVAEMAGEIRMAVAEGVGGADRWPQVPQHHLPPRFRCVSPSVGGHGADR